MWNLLSKSKKARKDEELKQVILKEYFNSANQKKAVTQAARESALDQRRLVERYTQIITQ